METRLLIGLMHAHRTSPQQGFTLVELAIVLVIIGLIIGGVLVGQDLIEAAETRKQIQEIERYDAAANTFRTKYKGIPGDIRDFTQYINTTEWPDALNGNGGAVFADYGSVAPLERFSVTIRQSSFIENTTSHMGGALANQCQQFQVRDSAFYANSAPNGFGNAIVASGDTFLTHITTAQHQVSSGASTLHKTYATQCPTQTFSLANSILGGNDRCIAQVGAITSNGGNLFGVASSGCGYVSAFDQQGVSGALGLSLGDFGNEFQVLGWNTDGQARPQVDFSQSAYCSTLDVRGLPRSDGSCDAGAFEQQ